MQTAEDLKGNIESDLKTRSVLQSLLLYVVKTNTPVIHGDIYIVILKLFG